MVVKLSLRPPWQMGPPDPGTIQHVGTGSKGVRNRLGIDDPAPSLCDFRFFIARLHSWRDFGSMNSKAPTTLRDRDVAIPWLDLKKSRSNDST